jgi:hypothetical protein
VVTNQLFGGANYLLLCFQRFSSSALLTTDTELIAIAAPAIIGLSMPAIASGMQQRL